MLLIDAYNVIRAQWALPAARRGMDIRALIGVIGRSRFAGRRLRVVVDGNPGPEWVDHGVVETLTGLTWTRLGRAEIVFSGRGHEADDVIEDILARSKGIEITVVSSDRRLIRAAGRAGASQIGNGSFLKLIDADLAEVERSAMPAFAVDVPLDKYAIAHWMHEFGFDPNGLLHPPTQDAAPKPELIPDEPAASKQGGAAPKPKPKPKAKKTKPPKGAGFGSRLGVQLPEAGPKPASEPVPVPEAVVPGSTEPRPGPMSEQESHEPLDPLLRDAFQEWFGSLHLDDLDMRKWVDGVEPL